MPKSRLRICMSGRATGPAALSAAAMQSLVVERGHVDCEFAGYGLDLVDPDPKKVQINNK